MDLCTRRVPQRSLLVADHATLSGDREPFHFAYVQQLAETGTLPTSKYETLSQEQIVVMRDLSVFGVPFRPTYRAVEPNPEIFGVRFHPEYTRSGHRPSSGASNTTSLGR